VTSQVSDPNRRGPTLLFHRVPEMDAFVERIVDLDGRKVHDVTADAGHFAVMQDPEGNELCVG
jgi:predicted enzyme related to lactoylglutathione lyase